MKPLKTRVRMSIDDRMKRILTEEMDLQPEKHHLVCEVEVSPGIYACAHIQLHSNRTWSWAKHS